MTDKDKIKDIPEMPEWEKAFSEYAKDQAPDLMPRILAKINQSEVPVTRAVSPAPDDLSRSPVEPAASDNTEEKASGQRKRFLSSLLSKRSQRWIISLSGAAAAVILIGVLIAVNSRIPKTEDRNAQNLKNSLTPNVILTIAAAPTAEAEPKGAKSEPAEDQPADNQPSDSVNYRGEDELGITPQLTGLYPLDDGTTLHSYRIDDSVNFKYKFKNGTATCSLAPSDADPNTYLLQDVDIAGRVTVDGSSAYRVTYQGAETPLLLLSDEDISNKHFSSIVIYHVGYTTEDDKHYLVFTITESTP